MSALLTCTTCKHFGRNVILWVLRDHDLQLCKRSAERIDPVTGKAEYPFASIERMAGEKCGPTGHFHSNLPRVRCYDETKEDVHAHY